VPVNLRHGTHSFTYLTKEGVLGNFLRPEKYPTASAGFESRELWVLQVSTVPLDHRGGSLNKFHLLCFNCILALCRISNYIQLKDCVYSSGSSDTKQALTESRIQHATHISRLNNAFVPLGC
jgi:hypothetical protein